MRQGYNAVLDHPAAVIADAHALLLDMAQGKRVLNVGTLFPHLHSGFMRAVELYLRSLDSAKPGGRGRCQQNLNRIPNS